MPRIPDFILVLRESKRNAFRGYLFSRINTDFLLISLFYADFYISRVFNFAKSAKIRESREN